jgi:uncharacterized membrane protein
MTRRANNHHFGFVRSELVKFRNDLKKVGAIDVAKKIDNLIFHLDEGVTLAEEAVTEAKMLGLRNPAFDGDYVGYPNDDFDDEDDQKKPS